MLNPKRTALLAALALAVATPIHAADEDEYGFSGSLDFVSDYAYRGISQTNEDPALQLGLDYSFQGGFYIGGWGSNVDFEPGDGADIELNAYFGWAGDITDGVAIDLQLVRYIYPGTSSGVDYDYNEFIGVLSLAEMVDFTLGYSNDVFATGEDGIYYAVSGSYGLPWADLSLDLSLGHYDLDDALGDSYTDYLIGVSREFGYVNASFAYINTDSTARSIFGDNAGNRVIFGLSYGF